MTIDPSASKSEYRIKVLDGWRCFAVLLVVLGHLNYFSGIRHSLGPLALFSHSGGLGVDLFFFISGFVICSGLISEERKFGRISIFAFYIRRFFRIFPPLWLYLATITTLGAFGIITHSWQESVYPLLFLCNFDRLACGWFAGHTWSLAHEEQFYLVFPLAFFLAVGAMRGRVFLLCAAIFPLLLTALFYMKFTQAGQIGMPFYLLALGVAAAMYRDKIAACFIVVPGFLISAGILVLLYAYAFEPHALGTAFKIFVGTPLIGFVIIGSIYKTGLVQWLLTTRPAVFFGRVSYGIYLWQQLATANVPGAGYGHYAISLSLMMVVVVASYYFIEKPQMALGHGMSMKIRERGSAAAGNA